MNDQQFHQKLTALGAEHGLSKMVLYARFCDEVTPKGEVVYGPPILAYDHDPVLMEESSYYIEQHRQKLVARQDSQQIM